MEDTQVAEQEAVTTAGEVDSSTTTDASASEDAMKLKEQIQNLNAALKEERDKIKSLRDAQPKETPKPETPAPPPSVVDLERKLSYSNEVNRLYARGFNDEQVQKIEAVAKGESVSLADASKSELYTAWAELKKGTEKPEESSPAPASSAQRAKAIASSFKPGDKAEKTTFESWKSTRKIGKK